MVSEVVESLWKAFDALRDSTGSLRDAYHIFALFAVAQISEKSGKYGSRGDPEFTFVIPESARWSSIRSQDLEVGRALNRACLSLEQANLSLLGTLTPFDFESPTLGDSLRRQRLLKKVVECIDHADLSAASNDTLGTACEHLLERLVDSDHRGDGEFLTPPSLNRLMIELIDPRKGMRIHDPTCGVGNALALCVRRVRALDGHDARLAIHGQEINMESAALCKIILLLNGFTGARIESGDVLRYPMLVQDGRLLKYDRIVSDPPMGLTNWGAAQAGEDPFGRFPTVPPQNRADYAFVQHCVASLEENGMAAILSSRGVLFRGGSEAKIRRSLIEGDRFEAVIGLPRNIQYRSAIPPVLLILRRNKSPARRGKILFIDAARLHTMVGYRSVLSPRDQSKVVGAFREYRNEAQFSRVVDLEEIQQREFDLSVGLYVEQDELSATPSLHEQILAIRSAEDMRDHAARNMDTLIEKMKRSF